MVFGNLRRGFIALYLILENVRIQRINIFWYNKPFFFREQFIQLNYSQKQFELMFMFKKKIFLEII